MKSSSPSHQTWQHRLPDGSSDTAVAAVQPIALATFSPATPAMTEVGCDKSRLDELVAFSRAWQSRS
jgi:hypothetical protein